MANSEARQSKPQFNVPAFDRLGKALSIIPVPKRTKEIHKGRDGSITVTERILFHSVEIESLLAAIPREQSGELISVLTMLELLGIIAVSRVDKQDWMGASIRATSEPAGWLIQTISKIITRYPLDEPVIRSYNSIAVIRPIIEAALEKNEINPHLILSNILQINFKEAYTSPLRQSRVISVLIKGERMGKNGNQREAVYLHVHKPDWDSYALIGSVQSGGRSELETARLAIEEDLVTPSSAFSLSPSGVEDEYDIELSITRGVYTKYAFNLMIVESLSSPLLLKDDIEYDWFTLDEIINQKSLTGKRIMTKAELLKKIDNSRGLANIPSIVSNPKPFLGKSIRSQVLDVVHEFRDVLREIQELFQLLIMRMWALKWWLMLMFIVIVYAIFLRPRLNSIMPIVSDIADILGIIGFFLSFINISIGVKRRR